MRTLAAIWVVGLTIIVLRLVHAFGRGCWSGSTNCVGSRHHEHRRSPTVRSRQASALAETGGTMTEAQRQALSDLCRRYGVEFDEAHYAPSFELPPDYVAGWIGGPDRSKATLYVGCDAEGRISS